MTKRDMSLGGIQIASPRWAGDFLSPDRLMPGGARLDASSLSAYPGPVAVRVGSIGSAAAAVANAGNTGNATVGTLSARIGAQTETISILFTDATHFGVTGSLSGALGTGTTGVAFTSAGAVNFTITAGGTPMVAGDGFTIALTKGANGALAGAAAIPVAALSLAIPAGTSLNFGVVGKFAIVAQTAAANAESIAVLPLDQALLSQDFATYIGTTAKEVPSGTFVSRTFAQRAAGALFHPAIHGEDEYYLTAFDLNDANVGDDIVLVKPKTMVVKENFLPGWAALSANLQADLRATYATTIGAE